MKIGYARVSTDEQNLGLQLDALQGDGCERVFEDTASGARSNRKGLADALQACSPGDVLTVWKLDRLGRSLLDLVGLVEDLKARDVGLKVLTGAGASSCIMRCASAWMSMVGFLSISTMAISLIEFVNPVFHITHFQPLQGYACAPNTPG